MSRAHQVIVATEEGMRALDGYTDDRGFPGLAVHLDTDRKWWVVTHLKSGLAMLGGCDTKREAESAARAFAKCADCTAEMRTLFENETLHNLSLSYTRAQDRWRRAAAKRANAKAVTA